MIPTISLLIASFLLSLLLVFLIIQNFSKQLLDIPNDRSSHVNPTPRGGGLGFVIAFTIGIIVIALLPVLPIKSDIFLPLILLPLTIIGFLDDRYNLPSRLRYGVQLAVAVFAVIRYGIFPLPFNNLGLAGIIIATILTVIGFTALINFYNFMDGLDGIVAGVCVVQFSFLAIYLQQYQWLILVSTLLGFLYWNWSPAKIFMGDVGSTFLGGAIAIVLLQNTDNINLSWSAIFITLPLVGDAIYTIFCRLIRKENIFEAHRTHIYQRLQQSGWSHQAVASTYILTTIVIAGLIYSFDIYGSLLSLLLTIILIALSENYLKLKVNYQ
ncbi:glycosyltransferase family 4 protein [Geminocystis sp. NIES-3709]|uniref:MraY family glycosyltransferase n=1 Tax=Geminocystis sp. NIES-3709 TaxID=1617448 RepID=UPI0005FC6075|nr:glycosyltransferase family 4 protein [Geminocystis sp. NIES-3709]BAQ65001.1 undecaprenyl-phosphate N-acetylglucosaminyl 1-phosphate transferase [Geminocystis sp. NIES-3709]